MADGVGGADGSAAPLTGWVVARGPSWGLESGRFRSAGRFWGRRPPPAPRRGGTGLKIDCSSNVDQNKYPARTWSRGPGDRPTPADRRGGTPLPLAHPTEAPSGLTDARDARGQRSPVAPQGELNPDWIIGPWVPWNQGTRLPMDRGARFFSSLGPLAFCDLGPLVPWIVGHWLARSLGTNSTSVPGSLMPRLPCHECPPGSWLPRDRGIKGLRVS